MSSDERSDRPTAPQAASRAAEGAPPAQSEPPAAAPAEDDGGLGRRQLLTRAGGVLVAAALGVPTALAVRSLAPNALYEQPLRFKAGPPASFAAGPTFLAGQRVFVIRQAETFHCMSAVCTHLGCTVQLVRQAAAAAAGQDYELACPCHGSKYTSDGVPYAGPAPRPLPHFRLAVAADDGQLVVDLSQETDQGWRLTV